MEDNNKNKHEHLTLIKEDVSLARHKVSFPPPREERNYSNHGHTLKKKMKETISNISRDNLVDPSLIFKIKYKNPLYEPDVNKLDIQILSNTNPEDSNDYIAFSDSAQMQAFFQKVDTYSNGIKKGNKSAYMENIFSNIDSIEELSGDDKMGKRLKSIQINDDEKYWINIELWHTGNKEDMYNKVSSYKEKIIALGDRVTDDCIGKSFCIMRAQCSGLNILMLLNEANIAEIDLIPSRIMPLYDLLKVDTKDLDIQSNVNNTSPDICIIDSGIMPGHPLMKDSIKEIKTFKDTFKDGIDQEGHGSTVASIALYGDIRNSLENKEFEQNFNLFISRVLDEYGNFPEEVLPENLVIDSIEYFHETHNCRIFNLSLGFEDDCYVGGKQFTLAQKIDELCREKDIFVCISIGNYKNISLTDIDEYPMYLFEKKAKIINPATSALSLTVGGLSTDCEISIRPERGANQVTFTDFKEPSPFTRTGPGINNSLKPEVCEFAGTVFYDGLTKRINHSNEGLGIVGCNHNFIEDNKLFTSRTGTSFAAPLVTNLAANILAKYPSMSANTVRAIIANSCEEVTETASLINNIGTKMRTYVDKELNNKYYALYPELKNIPRFDSKVKEINKIDDISDDFKAIVNSIPNKYTNLYFSGYGKPNLEKALNSSDNRVSMYVQDNISLDNFNIYEVYIPTELLEKSGKKKITVTLTFSPPTRHTRKDYLGYDMSYKLIRGLTLQQISQAFKSRRKNEDPFKTENRNVVDLFPGQTFLNNSTLKQSSIVFQRASYVEDYGNTFYLVVFNEKKWADETLYDKENFSLVVTVEHLSDEIDIDLYTSMKAHIDTRIANKANIEKLNPLRTQQKIKY